MTSTEQQRVEEIAKGWSAERRANFIRDTANPKWPPPMWVRALDTRLVDYRGAVWNAGKLCEQPRLSWTPLGVAVRTHLQGQAS